MPRYLDVGIQLGALSYTMAGNFSDAARTRPVDEMLEDVED